MPNQNIFQTPPTDENLIPELDARTFQLLDEALAREESRQLDRVLGQQEERGFLRSGNTQARVADEILGPGLQRRTQALLPLVRESSLLGREERLGELGFQRQRQFSQEEFGRRLEAMQREAEIHRSLMELEDMLTTRRLGNIERRERRSKRGSLLGKIGGSGIGAYAGYLGGASGSLGGPLGTLIGSSIGSGIGSELGELLSL